MEQDEEIICAINKDSIISSQDLKTQKETRKLLKQRSPDWDIIIKRTRKSTHIVQEWENWWDDSVILIKLLMNPQNHQTIQILTKEGPLV